MGSEPIIFSKLPATEKAEAVSAHFCVHLGILCKELSVQYQ